MSWSHINQTFVSRNLKYRVQISNLGVGSFDFEFKSARVMNMIKSSNFILVEHINTIKEIVQTNIL